MTKVEVQKMSAEQRQRLRRLLVSVLHTLGSEEEILEFITSVFTPGELVAFGRRLETAMELLSGTAGEDIKRKHRVGNTLINFVDSFLRKDLPDYRSTIPGLLRRPPQVVRRGIDRLKRRAPVLAVLLELTQQQSRKS